MKRWTLGVRLAFWSAALFAVAVALLAALTLALVRKHQIESLDAELAGDARSFIHELYEHGPSGAAHALLEIDKDSRVILRGEAGELLFRSPDFLPADDAALQPGSVSLGAWRIVTVVENGFTLHLGRPQTEVEAVVDDVRRAYLYALPVLLFLVAAGSRCLVRSALKPVQDISRAARRITAEQLDQRIPTTDRTDELAQLTGVLNEMLDRLDRGFRQAMRFTADASHELQTPLALVGAGLEGLLRRRDLPSEVSAELASLLEDNRRLGVICQSLLLLARADAGQLKASLRDHDLRELVEAAVEDARILAGEQGLSFELVLPDEASALVDARYFTQILLNLLSNAVKYNRPGGSVRVCLAAEECSWNLSVTNTGVEISPEQSTHLFERFYRVRHTAITPGHGLGLSLSRELARAHGGDLEFVCSKDDTTTFRLTLPRKPVADNLSAPSLAAGTADRLYPAKCPRSAQHPVSPAAPTGRG